ncbi:MAG: small basic family protein [Firmicutes bacterium]|nr:small basic family protein [Bacillota bacterium]
MVPVIGLIVGIILGIFIPYNIPRQYSNYVAVAILAALDSVFGGVAAAVQDKFDMKIFLSGFFGNALLAAGLAYIGDQLGIEIYLAAVFAFGNRLFLNFAIIRRYILNKLSKKDIIKGE